MELNHIHEFIVLAECKSYHEAADLLFIAQPSLSKHIKSLEKELGFELLDRSGKKTVLTEFGQAFLPYARKLDETRIAFQTDLLARGEDHLLKVGISPLFSAPDIAFVLSLVKEAFPDHHITVLQASEAELINNLKAGQCDLLLISNHKSKLLNLFDPDLYQVSPIFHRPLAALLPAHHPLSQQESISIAQLVNEPYIGLSKDPKWDTQFSNTVIYAERVNLIISLVQQGFGVSVLPAFDGLLSIKGNLCVVPITNSPEVNIALVSPRRRRDALLMRQIAAHLGERLI